MAINYNRIPIPGYETYTIDTMGRVYNSRGKNLVGILRTDGYLAINLYRENKGKKHLIHKLVCLAFIGPRPTGKEVNHKDGVKNNNNLNNLEWVTKAKNIQHAYANNLINRNSLGTANNKHAAKINKIKADEIRATYNAGRITKRQIARDNSLSLAQINRILKNQVWQ